MSTCTPVAQNDLSEQHSTGRVDPLIFDVADRLERKCRAVDIVQNKCPRDREETSMLLSEDTFMDLCTYGLIVIPIAMFMSSCIIPDYLYHVRIMIVKCARCLLLDYSVLPLQVSCFVTLAPVAVER